MAARDQQQELVQGIHSSGHQIVLAATGGGSGAIAALLEVPGASASVLEAVVPYAATALESWLGSKPDQFCSERTARAMAMAAFDRARALSASDPVRLRGIGATASLATTRPKRGPHRIHVAWQSSDATAAASLELVKGQRTRAEEEQIAVQLILDMVAESCGVKPASLLELPLRAEVHRREQRATTAQTEMLLGKRMHIDLPEQPVEQQSSRPRLLFPGAFNPLHAGHEHMAQIAAERYHAPVTFEISITNVDKPPLDFIEIDDRLQQFTGRSVLLTRVPTFAEKAALVPGCIFVVGSDTLQRIAEPRYYGGDVSDRDAAIATIAGHGCRFLVFGRTIAGRFTTLAELDVPPALRALCEEVPESHFHEDISSTELRNG
jgi:nicotinamide mononucleotide (NMN) deamidase PncC